MKIRLFKHDKLVPTIGIIKYRRFKKVFVDIVNKNQTETAIELIRALMARYDFDFLELEVPNEKSIYFIITGTWIKSKVIN